MMPGRVLRTHRGEMNLGWHDATTRETRCPYPEFEGTLLITPSHAIVLASFRVEKGGMSVPIRIYGDMHRQFLLTTDFKKRLGAKGVSTFTFATHGHFSGEPFLRLLKIDAKIGMTSP
jgi:hypothetical protein